MAATNGYNFSERFETGVCTAVISTHCMIVYTPLRHCLCLSYDFRMSIVQSYNV